MIKENDKNYERLTRYLAGESPKAEISNIEKWLEADPSHLQALKDLQLVWDIAQKRRQKWNTDKAWHRVSLATGIDKQQLNNKVGRRTGFRRNFSTHFTRITAAAVILVSIFYTSYSIFWKTPNQLSVHANPGHKIILELSDGSRVFLNSGSQLHYPQYFKGDKREVRLSGEAFFEVTNNTEKPFVVHTLHTNVFVLGTSFNIKAYENESTRITVMTGKVRVAMSEKEKNEENIVLLMPNEQVIYNTDTSSFTKNSIEDNYYSMWKDGILKFDENKLKEVTTILERWYNVKIKLVNEPLEDYRLVGEYKDASLRSILESLKFTLNVDYKFTNSGIIISGSNKQK